MEASPATKLTKELLIRTALRIADAEGLSALSMRRLGAELGVDPMAAYRHLPGKEALLSGIVDVVLADADPEVDPELGWADQLRAVIRAYRAAMLAHSPAVTRLVATTPLNTQDSLRLAEHALAILLAANVPPDDAVLAIQAIGALTCGAVLTESYWREQGAAGHEVQYSPSALPLDDLPMLSASAARFRDPQAVFEHALEAMVRQLETAASN